MSNTINPIANHLNISICRDAQDAIENGFNWNAPTSQVKPAELKRVVVVERGTASGLPTLDFVIEVADGKQYVFMTTAALLAAIPAVGKIARGEL